MHFTGTKWVICWNYFSTCVLNLILIFTYQKYFHNKVNICFGKRLAGCCSDKNVVTNSLSVVKDGWLSSEHDEIVRRTSGREPSSTPDWRETKTLLASLDDI